MPDDAAVLDAAVSGIEKLNERYVKDSSATEPFLLVPSPPSMERIGRQMDRVGAQARKLEEFNRLLRGAQDTSFVVARADVALLASIRYVITLGLRHSTAARHGTQTGSDGQASSQSCAV
jgi:cyclic beta-1,2-glucan synthetase